MTKERFLSLSLEDACRHFALHVDTLANDGPDANTHYELGIASELGEIASAVKKFYAYNQPVDMGNVREELGDLLFFLFARAIRVEQDTDHSAIVGAMMTYVRTYEEVNFMAGVIKSVSDFGPTLLRVMRSGWENMYTGCVQYLALLYLADYMGELHYPDLLPRYVPMEHRVKYIMWENIEKLNKRYPEGFSVEAALARMDKA